MVTDWETVGRALDWSERSTSKGRARIYRDHDYWLVLTPESWPTVRAFWNLPDAMAYAHHVTSGGDRS